MNASPKDARAPTPEKAPMTWYSNKNDIPCVNLDNPFQKGRFKIPLETYHNIHNISIVETMSEEEIEGIFHLPL